MRVVKGLAALSFVLFASGGAFAAVVTSTSKVDSVTVFPRGAEITRLSKVKLEEGAHTIVLKDLPASALPGSIRVEGKATGLLEIGSIDSRRLYVPRDDAATVAGERRRIEKQIETLVDKRAALDGVIKTARAQKDLIANLAKLPLRPTAKSSGADDAQTDWKAIIGLIGSQMIEAEKRLLDARIGIREVDRRITDLKKKLSSVAPSQKQRTEVKVFVAAKTALDVDLIVRYQVRNASWTPLYDARLSTGAKNKAPSLTIIRRAGIRQRSGESWDDVALTLSTTRPTSGSSAPVLRTQTVDFLPPPPKPKPTARFAKEADRRNRSLRGRAGGLQSMRQDAVPAPRKVRRRQARITVAPFQALYAVPGKVSVGTNGEIKRVRIGVHKLEPSLLIRTVPRVAAKAYLYARLTLPAGAPALPGRTALFRDGTFVGNGRLPLLNAGQTHELGFGIDDAVRVKHAVLTKKRGEAGFISSSKVDQLNFKTTIKNLHERPISVRILDRMPVAANEEISVELLSGTATSKQNVKDKRGVLAWDFRLGPDAEKEIFFGYRVSWPASKRIRYGR